MPSNLFITGTDTDCGKTLVTQGLLHLLRSQGLSPVGMKPVASGCHDTADGLRNPDALAIQALCPADVPYGLINPYAFAPPVAPHLAARQAGVAIAPEKIEQAFRELRRFGAPLLVEGVGGWRVPLNDEWDVAGLCQQLQLPAILVVGMRLGCINHALMSVESILAAGVPLAGWVANRVDPGMALFDENLDTLRERIEAPLLGVLPHLATPDAAQAAAYLSYPAP